MRRTGNLSERLNEEHARRRRESEQLATGFGTNLLKNGGVQQLRKTRSSSVLLPTSRLSRSGIQAPRLASLMTESTASAPPPKSNGSQLPTTVFADYSMLSLSQLSLKPHQSSLLPTPKPTKSYAPGSQDVAPHTEPRTKRSCVPSLRSLSAYLRENMSHEFSPTQMPQCMESDVTASQNATPHSESSTQPQTEHSLSLLTLPMKRPQGLSLGAQGFFKRSSCRTRNSRIKYQPHESPITQVPLASPDQIAQAIPDTLGLPRKATGASQPRQIPIIQLIPPTPDQIAQSIPDPLDSPKRLTDTFQLGETPIMEKTPLATPDQTIRPGPNTMSSPQKPTDTPQPDQTPITGKIPLTTPDYMVSPGMDTLTSSQRIPFSTTSITLVQPANWNTVSFPGEVESIEEFATGRMRADENNGPWSREALYGVDSPLSKADPMVRSSRAQDLRSRWQKGRGHSMTKKRKPQSSKVSNLHNGANPSADSKHKSSLANENDSASDQHDHDTSQVCSLRGGAGHTADLRSEAHFGDGNNPASVNVYHPIQRPVPDSSADQIRGGTRTSNENDDRPTKPRRFWFFTIAGITNHIRYRRAQRTGLNFPINENLVTHNRGRLYEVPRSQIGSFSEETAHRSRLDRARTPSFTSWLPRRTRSEVAVGLGNDANANAEANSIQRNREPSAIIVAPEQANANVPSTERAALRSTDPSRDSDEFSSTASVSSYLDVSRVERLGSGQRRA